MENTWKNNFNILDEFEQFLRNLFKDYENLLYRRNNQTNDKGFPTSIEVSITERCPLLRVSEIPYISGCDNSDYGKIQIGIKTHMNSTILSDYNFCEYFDNPDDARNYILKYKRNMINKIDKIIN